MRPAVRSCVALPRGKPDLQQALLVERHHAEQLVAEGTVPGNEVHQDRDVTWVVHAGAFWRNAGIMVRFSESTAARRLDALIARYSKHGRGMALWISPAATPENVTQLLKARRLRCTKYFPAMVRSLTDSRSGRSAPAGLEIRCVDDVTPFERVAHPSIGRITTPLRRQALERLRSLIADKSQRTLAFVAWLNGRPVGASELFLGSECAGLHGLSVPNQYRGQGIGAALVEHTCHQAARRGASVMALLASSDGERLYRQCGFTEVGRFGYWYRSFQRGR
jgi:GNAT superfamily N-acetyltransferase